MDRNAPIGVFDSGIGGLTVVREIMRQLPEEKIVYFGDTARLPYGNKSKETVIRFSRQIVRFLKSRGVKAIVVACNTASSYALEEVRKDEDIPVIGVINAGARAAVSATRNGKIGVIGTEGTIKSGTYGAVLREMKPGVEVFGRTEEIAEVLEAAKPDEIAITLGLSEYSKLEHIVAVCEKSGVHTKFIPDYNNIIPTRPYTEDLMGLPVINIRHVPLTNTFNAFMKRSMDLAGAVCAIIIFSPVMLVTAIAIKLTSPGPLIYTQERVGLHNRTFRMYKFRSMDVQSPKKERGAWTVPGDPRVTKVGKIIRKTSIDELPQLFNILKGDMSLVGPRPERPFFVEKFREEIPRYMIKHQVRPGMTGWAQINGYRGNTSIRKRIEYDLYYIENWTLGFDIKILFLTIFKGFINKNAY